MGRSNCVLAIVIAAVLGFCANAQSAAIRLDAPHNEDNGIKCYHCHSEDPSTLDDYWFNPPTGDIDNTTYNWVCLRCHSDTPTTPDSNHVGPLKALHASSVLDPSAPTPWSTECVDCHDPHFQQQIEWVWEEGDGIYVTKGTFDTGVQSLVYDSTDIYVNDTVNNVGGPLGTTLIGVTLPNYNTTSLIDPTVADWTKKGKTTSNFEARAVDHSRGLILIADATDASSAAQSPTYEIVEVAQVSGTSFTIKVNGDLTGQAAHGQTFGVIYGDLLKRYVQTPAATARAMKFFSEEPAAGSYGGYVDNTPGTTEPVGVCQVCHTQTANYQGDSEETGHYVGSVCTDCHNVVEGGAGSADHSTFIVDDNETGNPANLCSGCHTGADANPDTFHPDCTTCHTTPPTLLDSTFPTYDGQVDDDGNSMFTNLTNVGYDTTGRLLDAEGDDITAMPAATSVAGAFEPIRCGYCHAAKPDALQAANHGGHTAGHFGWAGGCEDCHGAGAAAEEVVKDIHANSCDLCHTGGTYDATTNGAGPVANGIDGDAGLAEGAAAAATPFDPLVYTCTTCHAIAGSVDAASLGGIHHDNATIIVANGLTDDGTICANCHGVAGHYGDHSGRVADEVGSCDQCHTGTAGTATGIPVSAADVKVHDNCGACHQFAAAPAMNGELIAAPGTRGVTTMNPGTAATNDGGGTCSQCHTAFPFTSHNHDHTVSVTTVAPCSSCHTGDVINGQTASEPNQGTHEGTCSNCHNTTTGARIAGANGWGDATVNGGAGGTCTDCHSAYFGTAGGGHTHGHGVRANIDGTCETCHGNGVPGTGARQAATGAPFVGVGDVHSTLECGTCHNLSSPNDGSLKGSAVGAIDSDSSTFLECDECHTSTWIVIHTGATVDHATSRVQNSINCNSCHANAVVGSNARDAVTSPFNGVGEVHNGGGCGTCHTGAGDGGLNSGPFTNADVLPAGGGTCDTCHANTSTWVTIHTGATGLDHTTRVDEIDGTACASCHSATAGGASGLMPVNGTDDKVHDVCTTCHTAAGGLVAGPTTYGGQTPAAGDCGTCHTATYFDSHVHGQDGGYVDHVVSYLVDGLDANAGTTDDNDTSQSGSQGCSGCHTPTGGLVTWTGISNEHNVATNGAGPCATCHNSPRNTGVSTGYTSVADVISITTGASCDTCHEDKTPSATHGGHDATAFPTVDAACADCHTNGVAGTVTDIHGDTCTMCHVSSAGGYGTTIVGAAANGVDGDATLGATGSATYKNATCLTCHDIADADVNAASVGGLHHDNKSSNTDCTTSCHTVAGHEGDHVAMIADAATNCTSACHTGTKGTISGAPISNADGKIHDTCTTCHEFAIAPGMNGVLVTAPGTRGVTTMNPGTAATNDGGGNCTQCHTTGWTSLHDGAPGVDHATSRVQNSANCNSCHANAVVGSNARDAITSPFEGVGEVHNTSGCGTCHTGNDDGSLNSGPFTKVDQLPAGGGTCDTCHAFSSTWTDIHTGAAGLDHTTRVDGLAACTTCHDATAGGAAGLMPVDGTSGNKVHDACTTCHTAAGGLVAGPTTYGGQTPAAGDCGTCHTATYFDSHTHHAGANNQLAFDSLVDRSQNLDDPSKACDQCHTNNDDAAGTPLDSFTDILGEHVTGCGRCHSYTDDGNGTPLELEVTNAIATVFPTPVNCTTCHVKKDHASGASSVHGGHDATAFPTVDAACADCHTNGVAGTVTDIHGDTCTMCHASAAGGYGTTIVGAAANGVDADATLGATGSVTYKNATCLTCHDIADADVNAASVGGLHHDNKTDGVTPDCATKCHTVAGHEGDHSTLISSTASCTTCHTGTAGTVSGAPTSGADGLVHDACTTCHEMAAQPAMNGVLVTAPGTRGVTTMNPGTAATNDGGGACATCHTWTWTNMHDDNTNGVDHSQEVSATASCTSSCHTTTAAGGAGTIADLVDGTPGNKVHDACSSCHNADGSVATVTASGGSNTINILAPNGGACATCHDTWIFDNHSHHGTANNQVAFDSLVDRSQNNDVPANACDQCHTNNDDAAGTPLDSWTDVLGEHVTGCGRCHSYTDDGNGTPLELEVTNAIATVFPTPVNCTTCHVKKDHASGASSVHGGHDATAFPTVDAACADCHTNGVAGTVTDIHGDTCTMCHVSNSGGYGTTIVGAAANGVDADATLGATGSVTYKNATCLTCHDIADADVNAASVGGLHHDNKSSNTDCTTSCHTVAGHEGDHVAMIADAATNCTSACHTGTKGTASGAPISGADGKIHDTCTTCHEFAVAPGMNGVLVTAPGTRGVTTMNPGTAATNDGGGNCTQCHTTGWTSLHDGAPGVDHATSRVQNDAACSGCHANVGGSDARDALTSPFKGAGEVHVTSGCGTCHTGSDDGGLNSGPFAKADQLPVGGGTCAICHTNTSTWTTIHTGATVDHATSRVQTSANCSGCHGDAVVGSNARNAKVGNEPFNQVGEVHNSANCATCHNADGSNRSTGLVKADQVVAGTCDGCHTNTSTWVTIHTGANGLDHTTRVDVIDGATCATSLCHNATAGGTNGLMPVDPSTPAGDKVHDACTTCHTAAGGLVAGPTTYGGQTPAAGDCGTCHTAGYFDSHIHGTGSNHNIVYDTTGGTASKDVLQDGSATPCANCHDDNAGGLLAWPDIYVEHTSNCSLCHSATRDINEDIPSGTTVQQSISGNGLHNCRTCHVPNWNNVPDHTGHDTVNDFNWDAAGISSCGDVGCHDSGTNNVLIDLHGNGTTPTCTICHSSPTGGNGTAKVGAATNGVDADATLANVTTHTDTCTVCHDIADADVNAASLGGIHHDNKTDGATPDCATKCHTVNGREGDHTNLINSTASCTTCHTGTAGGGTGTGAPTSGADGLVHDACSTCHQMAAQPAMDGQLVAAPNTRGVTTMNPGTAATNDGGGPCATCHTWTWTDMHDDNTNNVDHSQEVAVGATGCDSCHTATAAGGAGTIANLINAGDAKVHDACSTCHNADGSVASVTAWGGSNTINVLAPNGGDCAACHDTWIFDNHSHTHDVTYTPGVGNDRSQDGTAGNDCYDCHNEFNITTWAGVLSEHVTGCARCHSYVDDGNATPDQTVTENTISSGSGVICVTCHVPKSFADSPGTSQHGGHGPGDGLVQDAPNCTTTSNPYLGTCHGGGGNDNVAVVHGVSAGQCDKCHTSASGGDAFQSGVPGTGGNNCEGCHFTASTQAARATGHHTYTNMVAPNGNGRAMSGNCIFCHMPNVNQPTTGDFVANRGDITMPTNLACNWCHLYAPGSGYQTSGGKVQIFGLTWDPNGSPNTVMGSAASTTHLISAVNPSTTAPISDYGACFSCHGGKTYSGTNGNSVQVIPFHGVRGNANNINYTGDNGNNPLDGSEVLNIWAGPTITTPNSSAHTTPRHLGWGTLNWLQEWISPDGASSAVGSGKSFYNGNSGYKKILDPDASVWTRKNATYATTFDIPWDTFAQGTVGAPVNVTVATPVSGNQSIPTTVPTVPLLLP